MASPRTTPRHVTLGTLSLLLLLVIATPVHAQLTVDELELFVTAGPQTATRIVRVRNDATERVQATVTVEDWERDEHGGNRFLPAGAHAHSCAEGIEVFPASLALEPGESANLRIAFTGKPGIAANCWSIVFLENRATQSMGSRQLSYNVRTGIKVYGESSGAARDGLIERMALSDSAPGQLALTFRNAGDVQLRVQGAIEVRRADNSVVQRTPVESFPVLPGARRVVLSDVPTLPPGRYVLLALLDFGGSELVAGQMEYEVR